ncbi:MAG: GNAT family N-acetyltransferase [Isosphaeraceae bacterium]
MTLTIRDARADDLATIVSFNLQLAWETEHKRLDPKVLTRGVEFGLVDPGRLRYWVAEEAGRVVGQTAITREWSDWRGGWLWWLQSVYVAPDHRGQGVFRALYSHVRASARAEPDVIGLRLYVELENARAQRTYQALGMTSGGYQVYEELWPDRFNQTPG